MILILHLLIMQNTQSLLSQHEIAAILNALRSIENMG